MKIKCHPYINNYQGADMDLPTLYTPAQIADYLHVSRGTIYSLLHRKQIDSVKVGRNRRFTAEHVKDYLARHPQEVVITY